MKNCHSEIIEELLQGDTAILDVFLYLGLMTPTSYKRAKAIVLAQLLYFAQYRDLPYKERMEIIGNDLAIPRDTVIDYLNRTSPKLRELMEKKYGRIRKKLFQKI